MIKTRPPASRRAAGAVNTWLEPGCVLSLLTLLLDYLVFYVVWRLTGHIFRGQVAGRATASIFHYFAARTGFFGASRNGEHRLPPFLTLLILDTPVSYAAIRLVTAVTPVRAPAAKLVLEGLLFLAGIALAKEAELRRQARRTGTDTARSPVPGGGKWAWILWPLLILPAVAEVLGFRSTHILSQYVWEPVGRHRFILYVLFFSGVSIAFGLVGRRYFRAAVVTGAILCSFYAVGPAPVGTVLLYVFSCTVLGRILFGSDTEGPLAFLAGAALWIAGMYLTMYLPVHYAATHLAVMALPIIAGNRHARQLALEWLEWLRPTGTRDQPEPSYSGFCAFALLAFVMLANWLIVLKPEVSTDGLAMHLVIPSDMARHHFFSVDFHQFIWALMPMGADLGYAAVYTSGGEYAARLLNFAMLAGLVLLLLRAARSFVPDSVAALLAALFVSTPLVYLTTGSLFVENSVAFMVLGAVISVWRFHETRATRYLMLSAMLLGTSMALKLGALTAGLAGCAVLAVDLWRGRRNQDADASRFPARPLAAGLIVLLLSSIPYAKAWKLTGNPFFPFQTGPFQSALVGDDIRDERYNQSLSWRTPFRLTFETDQYFEGQPGSFGFQYLLFLPLMAGGFIAVRSFRNRSVIAISLLSGLIIAATQSNARYFYFLMPLLTLGTAPLFGWLRERQRQIFRAAVIAATLACFLNIRLLPSADWYHRDFYSSPIFKESGRKLYLHVASPISEVIQFVNKVDRTEPVVLVDSSQIAGVLAPVHSVQWHDYAFLKQVVALPRPIDIFHFFRNSHVAQLIVEKTRQDRPVLLTRLIDSCGQPEFTSGSWVALKLRPDCDATFTASRGTIDDTDPRITLTGNWVRKDQFPAAFGRTIAYTNARGAQASLTIEGTGFRYIYTKAFNRGVAEVVVDGRRQALVDLNSKDTEWQAHTDITGLPPGRHEVEIRAVDNGIEIDAIEVF